MTVSPHYIMVEGEPARTLVRKLLGTMYPHVDNTQAEEVFFDFVHRYHLNISRQPAAMLGDRMMAGAMLIESPGKTATIFVPRSFPGLGPTCTYQTTALELLRLTATQLVERDLAMIQAIQTDDNDSQLSLYQSAGFRKLSTLTLMEAHIANTPIEPDCRERIEWFTVDQLGSDVFGQTILQTYRSSLDCPELTGLRTTDEIIDGHRVSGIFEPATWLLARIDGQDVGVILLNDTEDDPHRMELVYMGVVESFRGKGLGRRMLAHAMHAAMLLHKSAVRLAVDVRNQPARRLYESFGFSPVGQQSAVAILNESRRQRLAASLKS